MNESTRQFVEKVGLFFESQGLSRSAGRIAGWLIVSEEPQTLDDLAKGLQISKGSVSTNTRMLERVGMIEKVSIPGDRKVYYQALDEIWVTSLRAGLERAKAFLELAREGKKLVPEERKKAHERLNQMERVYSLVMRETMKWIEQLEQED